MWGGYVAPERVYWGLADGSEEESREWKAMHMSSGTVVEVTQLLHLFSVLFTWSVNYSNKLVALSSYLKQRRRPVPSRR